VVLRRLAIFTGAFGAEAASVVAGDEIAASDVVDCVANLVTKSLVTTDLSGSTIRYRLPETTRAYALEKLTESGEFERIVRRHAECYRHVFEQVEAAHGAVREGDVS
jgi:predicted ATPase